MHVPTAAAMSNPVFTARDYPSANKLPCKSFHWVITVASCSFKLPIVGSWRSCLTDAGAKTEQAEDEKLTLSTY
jgi:hypothetical protein